jgi:DUF4097 and DUF4098 domain-containing protein YvlB
MLLALGCAATPAYADFRFDRQLMLGAGGTFVLDADIGAVTITGDSPSGALVSITSRADDFPNRYDIDVEERQDGVTVRVKRRTGLLGDLFRNAWRDNTRVTIRVPRATSTTISTAGGSIEASTLGNVRLRTSGGGITADEVQGAAELRTSGGSITARRIGGDLVADTSGGGIRISEAMGAVNAETSGGSIDIDGAQRNVVASTSGGGVRVQRAGGRVEAHTSGGSVTVGFLPGNGQGGDVSTSGGGISAMVDPSVALSIDASSSGGGVNSELPVTVRGALSRRELRADLNGGGPMLRLRTSGGGVRISALR